MGHFSAGPRATSVRLLNVLYDGVDWQLSCAHASAVRFVGDPFVVEVFVPAAAVADPSAVRVLVCGPPFDASASSRVDHVLTMHVPAECCAVGDAWLQQLPDDADGDAATLTFERTSVLRVKLNLAPFSRCGEGAAAKGQRAACIAPPTLLPSHPSPLAGFFDWRVVAVSSEGEAAPLPALSLVTAQELAGLAAAGALPAAASAAASLVLGPADPRALAQGRFIVHRAGALEGHAHEVIVDLEGMRFTDAGEIVKHGSFHDVAASVGALKGAGGGRGRQQPRVTRPSRPSPSPLRSQGRLVPLCHGRHRARQRLGGGGHGLARPRRQGRARAGR